MARNTENMYQQRNSSVWYLKINKPTALGGGRIRRSLKERDLNKAKVKRDIEVGKLREAWEREIAELNGEVFYTEDELKSFACKALPLRWNFMATYSGDSNRAPRPTLKQLYSEFERASEDTTQAIHDYVEQHGLELSSSDMVKVNGMMLQYHRSIIQAEIDEYLGNDVVHPEMGEATVQVKPVSDDVEVNKGIERSISLLEAIQLLEGSQEWQGLSSDTQSSYTQTYDLLKQIFPPHKVVGSFRPADFGRIEEVLARLPVRLLRRKEYDLEAEINNPSDYQCIAEGTHDRHVSAIKKLFCFLELDGYIATNFATLKLKTKQFKAQGNGWRYKAMPLSDDDCQTYFNGVANDGEKGFMYWVPALALFTGARLNEVCQLRPENIRQEDGVWIMDIVENKDALQRVKREGSIRKVPLHSALLNAGFLDFVAENQNNENGRIFKELKWNAKDKWCRPFRPRFAYRLKKWGIKPEVTNQRKGFHGFRYRQADQLGAAGVDHGIIDALMGWSSDDRKHLEKAMRDLYQGRADAPVPMTVFKEAIEKIKVPDWFV